MIPHLRVAVADDEPVMQLYLEETVNDLGHTVVGVAANGGELVELCRSHRPDLVITDIKMPVMDGLQAAREICRESPLPIVFVTGHANHEGGVGVDIGCVSVYLIKPVGEPALAQAMLCAQARHSQLQALLSEEPDVHKALALRQVLERAKTALKAREDLSDEEAFQLITEMARASHRTIAAVAGEIAERRL